MRKNPFKKNPHAVGLGRLGGLARAKSLSPEEIAEIGRKGARSLNQSLTAEERKASATRASKAAALMRMAKAKRKQLESRKH